MKRFTILAIAAAMATFSGSANAYTACFSAANGAYCVSPEYGIIRQVGEDGPYAALARGEGRIVRDFSLCSGQAEEATTPSEKKAQDQCAADLYKFEVNALHLNCTKAQNDAQDIRGCMNANAHR